MKYIGFPRPSYPLAASIKAVSLTFTKLINMKTFDIKLYQQNLLPKDDEYIWRYFDIHRFLSFLFTKQLRFTRMDQFEDALEGIPYEILQRFALINRNQDLSLAKIILDPQTPIFHSDTKIFGRLDQIRQIQTNTFVSCWFYEQRESMAMWDLYSNADGVALKIPFGNLRSLLKPQTNKVDLIEYYCGRVKYQDYRETNSISVDHLSKIGKVALRKDCSFSHEKEIRFVVKTSNNEQPITGINSETMNLSDLNMVVLCHPRMSDWKKDNINKILKNANIPSSFNDSEIKLRF